MTASAFAGDGSGLTGISGDNLGNHTATQALDMSGNDITNGGTVTAAAFVGDGSGLTNSGWSLTGNAGTVGGTNFIGTTDNVALDFRVNNMRALRIEPAGASGIIPNIIGGSQENSVSAGVAGATIGGGGEFSSPNQVTAGGGTVSGGRGNTASGLFATVPGGQQNTAAGSFSFAAGIQANALHNGTFVWADNTGTVFGSTAINQFLIRANGGVGINKNNPATALDVNGTVTATAFVGDGSGLTGISGDNLGNHTATQTLNLANNNVSNGGTVTANAFVGDGSGLTNLPGDNLGNHTATQMLNLANNNVSNGGTVTANAFVGDGSGLTNLPGDNLGNHTATQSLNLSGNNLINGGTVTASAFVGDGSGLTGVDNQTLSLSGTQLSITDGNSVNLAGLKDNLGNHTATQSLDMNGKWLTNDANFNNGIFLQTNGHVGIGTADPQAKLDIRPGNDGDPNSDPTSMTGLNVDISTFGGAGSKFAALFLGGNVGIGTSNPTQAKVVINGSVLNTLSYGWLNSSGQTGGSGSPSTNPYSLYTNERIAASEFNAHSDMRIKNIKRYF
ncbi:MAG: hypothetical protein H6628_09385 [Calditrichae bacterium]|nr:hypothetical protein [Calditrichia bacterium]